MSKLSTATKRRIKKALRAEMYDRIEAADSALSIRAENGEFGEGALICNGKVIARDVTMMDAMEHFRSEIHGTADPLADKIGSGA